MPGPITAYKQERARLEAAWQDKCRRRRWPVECESPKFDRYWEAHCTHAGQLSLLAHRHLRVFREARNATSRFELWSHIASNLNTFWLFDDPKKPTPRSQRPDVNEAMSALHILKIPWAEAPPYPDLTLQEAEDKLRYILNRLEHDDLQAEPLTDRPKKNAKKIENPRLRIYVDELRKIAHVYGAIPRGKRREIALRLCNFNLKKAQSLERGAREWRHLIDPI